MSETINGKWITDKDNNKIAPKTFVGQILSNDGTKNLETILDEEIGSLNTSLTHLEFGENGGGKNILKPILETTTSNGVTCKNNGDGTYTLNGTAINKTDFSFGYVSLKQGSTVKALGCPSGGSGTKYRLYCQVQVSPYDSIIDEGNGATKTIPDNADYLVFFRIYAGYVCNNLVVKPMLTTDTSVTEFEPYIPSVYTLTDDVSSLNTNLTDLKFLGWTVPEEMPIKNYYDESTRVFHQKVGRIDMGSLTWYYRQNNVFTLQSASQRVFKNKCGLFCKKYGATTYNATEILNYDKVISSFDAYNNNDLMVRDTSYTDASALKTSLNGTYLYYELATEQTFGDGEEIIFRILNGTATLDVDDVTE